MPKKLKPPAEPTPPPPTPAQLETARALFDSFRGAYSREGGYDIDVADVAEMVAAVEEPLQRRIAVLEQSLELAERTMAHANQRLTSTQPADAPAEFVVRSLRRAMEIKSRTPDPAGSTTIQSWTDVSVSLLTPAIREDLPADRLTVTVGATFALGAIDRWYLGIRQPEDRFTAYAGGFDEAGLRACFVLRS